MSGTTAGSGYASSDTFWQFTGVCPAGDACGPLGPAGKPIAPPGFATPNSAAAAAAAAADIKSTLPRWTRRSVCCVSLWRRRSTLRWNDLWHSLQEKGL